MMTRNGLMGATFTVFAGLFVAWALLAIAETLSRPPYLDEAPTAEVYVTGPEDSFETMQPGDGYRVDLPLFPTGGAYVKEEPRATQGSIMVKRFVLDADDMDRDLAAHLTLSRRVVRVNLNGTELYTAASNRSWSGNSGFYTDAYSLPRDLLTVGENTLVFSSNVAGRLVYPITTIDDAGPIMRSVWWSRFFGGLGVGMAAALLAFVAILFGALAWERRDRAQVAAVAVLALVWLFYNLNTMGWPRLWSPWHTVFGYVTAFLVIGGLATYTVWRLKAPALISRGVPLLTLLACLVPLLAATAGPRAVFDWSWPIEVWSKMVLAPLLIGALFYLQASRPGDSSRVETAAVTACLLAMFLDGVDDRFGTTVPFLSHLPLGNYALPWFGAVFALGLSAAIATQATRARRIALDHNDILESRLDQQQKQLQTLFQREKAVERERVLNDERQRLMRDMHDGIGGHLVSLMVQARSGGAKPDALARSLQRVLDDLRLIVDSLDTAGDSLGFALGAFRNRLEPKLKEAGVRLNWDITPEAAAVELPPDTVLQVLRIVQEVFSNALQHSGADVITLSLTEAEVGGALRLMVEDNGRGFAESQIVAGKGLTSMRQRAARIRASLVVEPSTRGGTSVTLSLPRPELVRFPGLEAADG